MTSEVHVVEQISSNEAVSLTIDTLRQHALRYGGLQHSADADESLPSRREAWLSLLDLSHLVPSLSEPSHATDAALDIDEALALHLAALEVNSTAIDGPSGGETNESEWRTALSKRSKRRARSEASEGLLDLPNGRSSVAIIRTGIESTTSSASIVDGGAPSELNEGASGDATTHAKKRKKKPKSAIRQAAQAEQARTPHKDESQVELDVMRSFVGKAWAQIVDQDQRPLRRRQLTSIIRRVLRAHPALSYYQGYHDVIAVLLVCLAPTLPETSSSDSVEGSLWSSAEEGDAITQAAERLSLHWLRDFMTSDLEPALGALKLIRNLLRRADVRVADIAELASPLPYFALSWYISLFCHDLEPTLSVRAMDWFLVEGPGAAIYAVVALVLSDREALLQQADDPDVDPAEIHHHLSQLSSSITSDSLEDLLVHASELSKTYALEHASQSEGKRKVMGSSSVLCTFPNLQRRSKAEAWKAKDVHAESILRGPVDRIVVDPTPTPPTFDDEDDVELVEDGLYKAPEKLHISKRDTKHSGGSGVLLVGAVGAAAAILLFAATGGRLPPQTIELLKNLAMRSR